MSGQITLNCLQTPRARKSKSRATRVRPCTQTSTSRLRGSPHSRYAMRCRPRGEMHCTERRRGCGTISSAILLVDIALDELAGLDHGAPGNLVVVPRGFDAQLGEVGRGLHEDREGNA